MKINSKVTLLIVIVVLIIFTAFSIIVFLPQKVDYKKEVRSSDLIEKSTEDGNIQRTDYYNKNGGLSFAADKHFATVIKTRTENTLLEEYFDEHGKPTKQPSNCYAMLKEIDELGRIIKLTYLDIDGQPMIITSGYSIVERTFDQENRIEWEMYFDTDGNPIKSLSSGYGCHYEYNEKGQSIKIVYVDEKRNPYMTQNGYAILHRSFYEDGLWLGKVKNEFFFDERDNPIAISHGEYGLHREYDNLGRNDIITYINDKRMPILTNIGYSTIKKTFYPDDSVKTEMYYDQNGQPIALSEGQYGRLIEGDKITYLDAEGKKKFNLQSYLHSNHLSVIFFAFAIVLISTALLRKRENVFLAVLYTSFIIFITLLNREKSESRAELELFWSYRIIFSDKSLQLEILKNIWLFVPIGSILRKIWADGRVIFFAVAISLIIEVTQFITGFGLAEFDDIISNGIGALIGFGYCYVIEQMLTYIKSRKTDTSNNQSTIVL